MKARYQIMAIALLAGAVGGGWWLFFGSSGDDAAGNGKGKRGAVQVLVEVIEPLAATTAVEAVGTGSALHSIDVFPVVAGRVTEVAFVAGQAVAQGDALLRLDDQAARLAVRLGEVEVQRASQLLARYQKAAPTGGVPASDLDAARIDLDRVRLQLEQARVALADRTVVAPFAGAVGLPQVDPGDLVSTATPITTLDDRSQILITFTVPEIHAGRIQPGQPIDLTAWSLPGRTFSGVIDSTASRLDPQARSLTVRARVPNPEDVLRPGMSFGIRIDVPGNPYPAINEVAVMWGKSGAFVWRVGEGDKAEKVPVRIVRRDGARVLVDGPLKDGDRVVVEGVQRMRDGIAVSIVDPAADGG